MNMDEWYGYYPCFSTPTKASIVILQTLDPEINPIKRIRHPITEENNIIKIWNKKNIYICTNTWTLLSD